MVALDPAQGAHASGVIGVEARRLTVHSFLKLGVILAVTALRVDGV